jgi:hypothetical protein
MIEPMTDAERQKLAAAGHTEECIKFWADVVVMEALHERWDHWTQPTCPACSARRVAKGMAP